MPTAAVRKLICAALAVLSGAASVRAGDYTGSSAGTSSGKFLAFGSSARAAAMGEAYCAAAQGADAVRYNPAALVRIEANSAELMHANYLADTFLDQGAFARRLGPNQAIGFSALQMSYGSIPETDETGYRTGTAHPANLALTGAYAYKFEGSGGPLAGSAIGVSAGYVQSTIVSSAKTFTASLGLLSPAYGPLGTQFAFAAENLAGALKFDQKADPLPLAFKLGALLHIKPDWVLALELAGPKDGAPYAALGTEKLFKAQSEIKLAVRAGYNMRTGRDLGGLAGFAAGLGIAFNGVALDYALVPFGTLGYTHKLTLGFSFGADKGKSSPEKSAPQKPAKTKPAPAIPAPAPKIPEGTEAALPAPTDNCLNCLEPADKYFAQKDYENAALEYKKALESIPETDSRRIYVYERQGQLELKGRNLPKAKDFFLAAIQTAKKLGVSDTNVVNAYLGLAYCFEKTGNIAPAVKNYEKAMELSASEKTKARIKTILRKLAPGE